MASRSSPTDHDPRWSSKLTPAPGDLRRVQAFLNTANPAEGSDLASPRALTEWLELWDLVPRGTVLDDGDFRRAIEVRETLRALLVTRDGEAASDTARRLDQATAAATIRVRFATGGRARFEPAADGLDGALGCLCGIVAAAQFEGTWLRMKTCVGKSCHAVFFDFSKNHSGKWCSPQCNSRSTSLAYRRRNLEHVRDQDRRDSYYRRRRR